MPPHRTGQSHTRGGRVCFIETGGRFPYLRQPLPVWCAILYACLVLHASWCPGSSIISHNGEVRNRPFESEPLITAIRQCVGGERGVAPGLSPSESPGFPSGTLSTCQRRSAFSTCARALRNPSGVSYQWPYKKAACQISVTPASWTIGNNSGDSASTLEPRQTWGRRTASTSASTSAPNAPGPRNSAQPHTAEAAFRKARLESIAMTPAPQ